MARYSMRQRIFSFGEDFTVKDDEGKPAFEVDGKVFSLRDTFELRDMQGNVVATVRSRILSLHDTMDISRGGEVIATVKKAWLTMFRDRFNIDVRGGGELVAQGDFLDHEYTISRDGEPVARISKKWFTLSDTYGIDIADGEDAALMIAVAVTVDELAHDKKED